MKKNIGYSNIIDPEKGTINHLKLVCEFDKADVKIDDFGLFDDGHIELTFDDALESKVDEIIRKHDPTPLPDNDTIFSVKKVADVISKAASNIAFYAKNAVGGGVQYQIF